MPAPYNWGAPVIRLGAILSASWNGPDDDLSLVVVFLDEYGSTVSRTFKTTTQSGGIGDICLPSSATILNISDEVCIAHSRMAGWIAGGGVGLVPGSTEWLNLFQDEGKIPDFQMSIGNARIYGARPVSDTEFEFDIRKKGTSSPTKTVRTDYGVFLGYSLEPSEAIRCVAGGVKWAHPTYIHDYKPGQSGHRVLSQSEKDTIIATVLSQDIASGLNNLYM